MAALEQGKRRRELLLAAQAAAAESSRTQKIAFSPAPAAKKRIRAKTTPIIDKTPTTMTPDPKTARIEVASTKKKLFGDLLAK